MSDAGDPNEIYDRIAARLEPATAEDRKLVQALSSLASDAYELEWRAQRSGEAEMLRAAAEHRQEIENGEYDNLLDVARKVNGGYGARLAVWDVLSDGDRSRIKFVWALIDQRQRTGGADFWTHAKALKASRDWGFGDAPRAIQNAIKVAEAYGVSLGEFGPGKPRGRRQRVDD